MSTSGHPPTPQQQVRAANEDIHRNCFQGGPQVYGILADGRRTRIVEARSCDGDMQGRELATGDWIPVTRYETD